MADLGEAGVGRTYPFAIQLGRASMGLIAAAAVTVSIVLMWPSSTLFAMLLAPSVVFALAVSGWAVTRTIRGRRVVGPWSGRGGREWRRLARTALLNVASAASLLPMVNATNALPLGLVLPAAVGYVFAYMMAVRASLEHRRGTELGSGSSMTAVGVAIYVGGLTWFFWGANVIVSNLATNLTG